MPVACLRLVKLPWSTRRLCEDGSSTIPERERDGQRVRERGEQYRKSVVTMKTSNVFQSVVTDV